MRFSIVVIIGMMANVTLILQQIDSGNAGAADQLLPIVYDELRRLAAARLAQEQPGQTLQATALVHESYLRLVGGAAPRGWNSRGHFFGAAAEAMRRILIDQARAKGRQKRGGGCHRFSVDVTDIASHTTPEQLLVIDEALEKLKQEHPAIFSLVNLRYFAGLRIEEAAAALGISSATAYRYWAYARSWLHAELLEQAPD